MPAQEKHFDYITEAHLTASPNFYGGRVPFNHFAAVLSDAIEALHALDRIKKTLFYGRDLGPVALGVRDTLQDCENLPDSVFNSTELNSEARNIIHGIIGKATEAGELLQALQNSVILQKKFDAFNVIEEIGDGLWYDALLLRVAGSNFGEAQAVNIRKLRHRFPNAFADYDANNRDLAGERRILEGAEKSKEILSDYVDKYSK